MKRWGSGSVVWHLSNRRTLTCDSDSAIYPNLFAKKLCHQMSICKTKWTINHSIICIWNDLAILQKLNSDQSFQQPELNIFFFSPSRSSGRRRVHPGSVGQWWSYSFDSVSAFKVTLLSNTFRILECCLFHFTLHPLNTWKYMYKMWTLSRYINPKLNRPAGLLNFSYQCMGALMFKNQKGGQTAPGLPVIAVTIATISKFYSFTGTPIWKPSVLWNIPSYTCDLIDTIPHVK